MPIMVRHFERINDTMQLLLRHRGRCIHSCFHDLYNSGQGVSFAQLFFDYPVFQVFENSYYLPFWAFPLFWLAGALDLLFLMHIARGFGRFHAWIAKGMLARPGI